MTYKIGVDGGGTKTECILVDASGQIVARHIAPGCNPNVVGRDEATRIVTSALADLVSKRREFRLGPSPCSAWPATARSGASLRLP